MFDFCQTLNHFFKVDPAAGWAAILFYQLIRNRLRIIFISITFPKLEPGRPVKNKTKCQCGM
jgi:hypothetical protein